MNKIFSKIKIGLLACLLLATTSCSDFLNQVPEDSIPSENALESVEDCKSFMFGIYSSFKSGLLYSGAGTLMSDIQTDYMYSVKGYSNSYGEVYKWMLTATTPEVENIYRAFYVVVSQCNFFFDYKDNVKIYTEDDRATMDKITGEVYFARALAFAELIKYYSEAYDVNNAEKQLGISLALSYIDRDQQVLRSSLKDSYAQVLSDLAEAEKLVQRDVADAIYFTKGAVKTLQARVYLYMQEYEKAVEAASEVIESGTYTLADATKFGFADDGGLTLYDPSYYNMFRYDTSNEIIWKVAMSNTDRGGALGAMFINYNGSIYLPDYVPAQWVLDLYGEYGSRDFRTLLFFSQKQTGYVHGLNWPLLFKYPGNPNIDAGGRPLFTNMPKVFRLSELYLIRAEANYHLGNEGKANDDLNALRKKRIQGFGGQSFGGNQLFEQIKKERTRELYMEGHRLADLKRWHEGFKREVQAQTNDHFNELDIPADHVQFTWPIPQHEIDAVPGIQVNPSNGKR